MTASRRERLLARMILATRAVDTAYRRFDSARSRVVVRAVSTQVLGEFNAMAYERDDVYHPAKARFRDRLFPWEAAAVREHFPPPPGRVLLGGAGGGREAFALADRGYDVIAFEPAPELAAAMAIRADPMPLVSAFRGGYEDLPQLHPARPIDTGTELGGVGPFSAAIMGWGSFSHLATPAARRDALSAVAAATTGPILVSFLAFDTEGGRAGAAGHPGRPSRAGEHFSIFIGYYHTVTRAEIEQLAREAGLEVVALNTDETDSTWPHAILRRST